jgi:dolichol kinase
MDSELRARILRRGIHISSAGLLSYYLVPPDMWGVWPGRGLLVLTFLVPVLVFEAYRQAHRQKIEGMRDNEKRRISAVAWGATGMALAFFIFPQRYVVPCVLGMAFVDPLIGELRRSFPRAYPVLPAVVYFAICTLAGLSVFQSMLAMFVALAAEAPKIAEVDDDFRMLVAPLAVLWIVQLILPV